MKKGGRGKRALKILVGVVAALAVALVVTYFVVDAPRPEGGVEGPRAEALAARIEAAVDVAAWAETGAVAWTFAGKNEHLWDRARHLARVRWDDHEARFAVDDHARGRVTRGGVALSGEAAREALDDAYAYFINDSFWLNPLAKLRDPGVSRAVVPLEGGGEGLLVSYASGGLTPGDAYLWIAGDDGRPRAWRMWVSVIPVGGLEASWEGWRRLDTGAWIATRHQAPLGLTLELSDVRGAATLAALVEGPDPFADVVGASASEE